MKVVLCIAVLIGCAACKPFGLPWEGLMKEGKERLQDAWNQQVVSAWDSFATKLNLPKSDDPKLDTLTDFAGSSIDAVKEWGGSEKKARSIAAKGKLRAIADLADALKAVKSGDFVGAVTEAGDAVGKVVQSEVEGKAALIANRIKAVGGLAAAALNALGRIGGGNEKLTAAGDNIDNFTENLAKNIEKDLVKALNGALVGAGYGVRDAIIKQINGNKNAELTEEEKQAIHDELLEETPEAVYPAEYNVNTAEKDVNTAEKDVNTAEKDVKTAENNVETTVKYVEEYQTQLETPVAA